MASRAVRKKEAEARQSELLGLLRDAPNGVPRLTFTLPETAKILGISYVSVWRLVKRKKLKVIRDFRYPLVPKAEIEKYVAGAT
jgi:hypothetical protein